MAKITLDDNITNVDPLVLNENFRKIEDHLNNKVLYRNTPIGEPNELETPIDANGKRIYNLPSPTEEHEPARVKDVEEAILEALDLFSIPGPKGDPGDSAYQIAVDEGFVGTKEQWLESLIGPKGDVGPPGPEGKEGPKGEKGDQGAPGTTVNPDWNSTSGFSEILNKPEGSGVPTPSAGWSATGVSVYRMGNHVKSVGVYARSAGNLAVDAQIATIPTSFRPGANTKLTLWYTESNGSGPAVGEITTAGVLRVKEDLEDITSIEVISTWNL